MSNNSHLKLLPARPAPTGCALNDYSRLKPVNLHHYGLQSFDSFKSQIQKRESVWQCLQALQLPMVNEICNLKDCTVFKTENSYEPLSNFSGLLPVYYEGKYRACAQNVYLSLLVNDHNAAKGCARQILEAPTADTALHLFNRLPVEVGSPQLGYEEQVLKMYYVLYLRLASSPRFGELLQELSGSWIVAVDGRDRWWSMVPASITKKEPKNTTALGANRLGKLMMLLQTEITDLLPAA